MIYTVPAIGLQKVLDSIQNRRMEKYLSSLAHKIAEKDIPIVGKKVWYGHSFKWANKFTDILRKKAPEVIWIHFLKEVDDPKLIHVDEHLLDYAKILIESIREKTKGFDEESYPCTCGGYCERDFT